MNVRSDGYAVQRISVWMVNLVMLALLAVPAIAQDVDLTITKTDSADPVVSGQSLTYLITVTNTAATVEATSVVASDELPAGVTFVSATVSQGASSESGGVVTADFGNVSAGASASMEIVVTVDSATTGVLTNQASAEAAENDPVTADNATSETTATSQEADLSIAKTDDVDPVLAGGTLVYTVTVTNSGPSDATSVVASDEIPAGTTFGSATVSQGASSESAGVVTANFGTIVAGASASMEVTVTVDPSTSGLITNLASVESGVTDPVPANNTAAENTTVQGSEIDVTGGPLAFGSQDVDDGQTAAQSVTITNTGSAELIFTGAGIALVGGDAGQFAITNGPATTPLASGASREVQVAFDPTTAGAKAASLEITTTDSDEPTVQVALSGTGIDGEITVTGGPLAFGGQGVDAGPTAPLSITVINDGASDLSFTGAGFQIIGAASPEFAITNSPATTPLATGASREVQVTFDPAQRGARAATLRITTDDKDEPTVDVGLTGSGIGVVYVDLNGDNTDGASWATAYTSIQTGITSADANNEQVWVADGTHSQAIAMASGVEVYGGFTGLGGLEETSLDQRDPQANATVIDVNLAAFHVVTYSGTTDTVLDGLTITGGNANGGGNDNNGAGIIMLNVDDSNTLSNCLITDNVALTYGGGLFALTSSPEIIDCKFTANSANTGGGMLFTTNSVGRVERCVISGNNATFNAGGIVCANTSDTAFINCLISGNVATAQCGGFYAVNTSAPSLTNCTISDNRGTEGGGVWVNFEGDPVITNTIFENNTNHAVFEDTTNSDPILSHCLFRDNPDGDLFDENSTSLTGAASIEALAQASDILDGDPAFAMDGPAGITGTWNEDPLYSGALNRTLLTDTTASFATGEFAGMLLNANTAQRVQACIVDNTATTITVTGNATAAPVNAASGESYQIIDYHLDLGSAAIDTGTAAGAPADDIEGTPRPLGLGVDLGIYEAEGDITAAPASLEFGNQDIGAGATAPLSIVIENTGVAPLVFTGSAVALTGPAAGDFAITNSPATSELAAGASREIAIAFDPTVVGARAASLEITSDDPDEPTVEIALSGTGVASTPDIDVTGGPLAFGSQDVDDGQTAPQSVVISNVGNAALSFTGAGIALVGPGAGEFAITNSPPTTPLAAGASREVQVAFDPTAVGAQAASLEITTDDADESTVQVALSGTGIDPEIDVTGGPLAFGSVDVDAGATASQTITITNTGTATLGLSGVALAGTDPGEFAITADSGETSLAPLASRTVDVAFDPTSAGTKSALLRITSDDTDEPTVDVALGGTGIDPEIDVTGGPLNFGSWDVDAGATASQTVTITNIGTATLSITSVTRVGTQPGAFLITADSGETTLAPTQSRTVDVAFDPGTPEPKSAILRIASDDTDEPTVDVALSGTAIDQEINVSPSSAPFGDVEEGTGPSAPINVTITNTGTNTLSIFSVTLSNNLDQQFAITGDTGGSALAPSASRIVTLVFNPTLVGPQTADLEIASDDTNESLVVVPLTGNGTGEVGETGLTTNQLVRALLGFPSPTFIFNELDVNGDGEFDAADIVANV
ncbi:choice-of-anchor D domain-containing protein, partial [Candidatus Sumerlaeota bacterium]|nr:choice-of-anchor D domain-containing protein [Candidatus Sumerlaeota bacterium]